MILLQIISIDLTRMECKAEEGYIAWMEEFGIDLTRMECKDTYDVPDFRSQFV